MSPLSSYITLMAGGLWTWFVWAFVIGYLLGSIPFGLILTRFAGLGDVRNIGSGNIGATNVLRTGHKGLAAGTLMLDALKGTAAVLIADHWFEQAAAILAGLGAFLGHLYPVWLKFKGGKGVATFFGILFAIAWPVGLAAGATWIIMALVFRMSSLAGLTAAVLAPVWFLLLGAATPARIYLALGMTVLILIRHDANSRRLLRGEEPRIGRAKTGAAG